RAAAARAHRPGARAGGEPRGRPGRRQDHRRGPTRSRCVAGRCHRRLPGQSRMSLLAVEDLDCRYGLLQAVRGVSLQVAEGETVALIGANGAGKTTLMRAIAGAHPPHAGRVKLDGTDITSLPAHNRVRRGIVMVREARRVLAGLTVEENLRVAAASRTGGRWNVQAVLEVFPFLKPRLHM